MLRPVGWKIGIALVLFGCSASSLEEVRAKGSAQIEQLLQELYAIETREDLVRVEPKLKLLFEDLVDTMIEARFLQYKEGDFSLSALPLQEERSYCLREELKRIYLLEGGRECVEKIEREAMLRLDAKEKLLNKQQQFRGH